jgi:predicted protein tyrosine phosphatase
MDLHTCSRQQIETLPLPGPSIVISMADSEDQLAELQDTANLIARLNLIFNDATEAFGQVRPPTIEDAKAILSFVNQHLDAPNLVIQCQVGIGRSVAVMSALLKLSNWPNEHLLEKGMYNRALYRKLLLAAGQPIEPDPLVSINVRVKYAPDRLKLFLLSMQRQRHENWEVVAVTDGPNPQAARVVAEAQDERIRLIETEKPLGRWGHPNRQLGLDACRGEFIGLSNDDNYYVPGYLEQMLNALKKADVATCLIVHSYTGWEVVPAGHDLGAWIARASLVRQIPWPGQYFTADADFLQRLVDLAGDRVVRLQRPLFVHN